MKRVVFLDFHGVLQRKIPSYHRKSSGAFDPECVEAVNALVSATDAGICVTSTERMNFSINELQRLFVREGVNAKIVGVTRSDLDAFDLPDGQYVDRGCEIEDWIRRHDPESFIIIDDNDDMGAELRERLIQTVPEMGLTADDVEKAIFMLRATS